MLIKTSGRLPFSALAKTVHTSWQGTFTLAPPPPLTTPWSSLSHAISFHRLRFHRSAAATIFSYTTIQTLFTRVSHARCHFLPAAYHTSCHSVIIIRRSDQTMNSSVIFNTHGLLGHTHTGCWCKWPSSFIIHWTEYIIYVFIFSSLSSPFSHLYVSK